MHISLTPLTVLPIINESPSCIAFNLACKSLKSISTLFPSLILVLTSAFTRSPFGHLISEFLPPKELIQSGIAVPAARLAFLASLTSSTAFLNFKPILLAFAFNLSSKSVITSLNLLKLA